jgi:(E)-2-((N-methylformamido)methylene)succinate hydrolase
MTTSAVVLIHGISSSHHAWDAVVAELDAHLDPGVDVVRYDLRGHGDAPTRPLVTSVDDFVDDLIALLDQRAIATAHVVGFSLGGLIAQRTAVREPHRVDTLTVIGSVAGRTPEESARARERLHAIETLGPVGVAEQSITRWYTPAQLDADPGIADRVLAQMAALDAPAYAAAYRVLATTDLAADLHRITAPTLAITGEFDVGSPPHMSELIAARTGGRAVIIGGAKHSVLGDQAPLIAKEIGIHVHRDQR